MNENLDPYDLAERILGWPGAMLSGSKTAAPERRIVWNANVVVGGRSVSMKIWYGDISITESSEKLQTLADELGVAIHVLREMDARFDNEFNPLVENAVATFNPNN